ncbi:MAG: transcription/translation regulatory transformer protein RfaH [Gammaproteobacteria bacterium]|nr:transcription/translation regulatory transformer protein RfaH [Woeseia sp.]MBU2676289.1 transcription/translation regulatory transformer protein RfaH [Gammaproteobacteria bacterium]NNL50024.1 transcription/translation regulatory transformer protein RfaH [Woeseiaceae bacterium]
MRSWYLIYSKSRQEKTAFCNLSRQGFTVYFPQIRRTSASRKEGAIEPMFPRYLFIQLDDDGENWSTLRSTIGVSAIVRFGEYLARVPDSLIAALRGLENEQGIRELYEPAFQPGDHVRIADGALKGYEAVFEARAGNERVRLLLETAGTRARLEMKASQIEVATH